VKRLLLASAQTGALRRLVDDPARMRFAFVPTAAGPDSDSKPWVRADRAGLEAVGCDVSTLELAAAGPDEVQSALSLVDAVFVTGGNTYLLLWHAQRSGFAELVVPLVESGELLFAGTSAGSILAGPDVFPASSMDQRAAAPELESTRGLGLVDFSILPHDQEPESRAYHDEAIAAGAAFELIRLTDDRAVVVRGDDWEVVDSPPLQA